MSESSDVNTVIKQYLLAHWKGSCFWRHSEPSDDQDACFSVLVIHEKLTLCSMVLLIRKQTGCCTAVI